MAHDIDLKALHLLITGQELGNEIPWWLLLKQDNFQKYRDVQEENDRLRKVLVKAAIPLEVINISVKWELHPELKAAVNEAVISIREALKQK